MKKIITLLLSTVVLFGCEGFLDRLPLDRLTDGDFFANETGLQAFSNSFYGIFPSVNNRSGDLLALDNADNMFMATQSKECQGIRVIPSDGEGWSWTTLRNINTLCDNLYQCSDETVRTKYEAIARWFRAYFYFEKVKRFGDVPWYDHQVGSSSEDLYKPRDPRELVIQNVIKDLEFAAANLPADKTVYTVNKYTAQALLSRVCLFEGTFRKYHTEFTYGDGAKSAEWYLTKCAEVSEDFIKNSGYKIYNTGNPKQDYLMLFGADKYSSHDSGCEVILARNFSAQYGSMHAFNNITLVASMDRPGMSRKQVATYLMADGTRFTDQPGWETMFFTDEVKNRDPRLAQSIRTPGYTRIERTAKEAPILIATNSGYQTVKHVSSPGEGDIKDVYNQSDKDIIVLRAGEVYLNYAEAKAELGQLDAAAIALSLNPLRARAGMPDFNPNPTADPFLTNAAWGGFKNCSDPKILEVRRERAVELYSEGLRYYDLMRWKEGAALAAPMYGVYIPGPGTYDFNEDGVADAYFFEGTKDGNIKATYTFEIGKDITLSEGSKGMFNPFKNSPGSWDEDKDYLYPIPSNEIQLNPNLVQNPNWK